MFKKGQKSVASLLSNKKPIIIEGKIELELKSDSQNMLIEEIKTNLINEIRTYFGNENIQLIITINPDLVEYIKPYTDSEKLEAMLQKNRDLYDFIQQIDLSLK